MINISQDKEKRDFSAREMINQLLSLVSAREAQILSFRYGLEEDPAQTLSQIGEKLKLTRERVRQLEKQAFKTITSSSRLDSILSPLRHLVIDILKFNGGLTTFKSVSNKLITSGMVPASEKEILYFLLDKCLTGISRVSDKDFELSFKLPSFSLDFVRATLDELEKIFAQTNKILTLPEIVKKFKASEYYSAQQTKISELGAELDALILAYLEASTKFVKTPFDQWGLKLWPSVTPKRINGKIYLVLKAKQKPLHFTKISSLINENWPVKKSVQPATVHNELIADKRFVLVGRGIYALAEHGYTSGSVQEIVKKIMAKNLDLKTSDIIDQVKEKKLVKESTIRMAIRKNKNSPR